MNQYRHFPAKRFVEAHVQGGGAEPFDATGDVGNLHQVVIYDNGEMIGGQTIGFEQNVIG